MIDDMPRKLPLNVTRERTRHGRVVFYHRVGKGPRTRLPDDPTSTQFYAEYRALELGEPTVDHRAPHRASGTFAWLVEQYYRSADWSRLAPATQKQRRLLLEPAIAKAGSVSMRKVTQQVIRRSVAERSATPALARNFLKSLRALFKWAAESGHIETDPTTGVALPKYRTSGFTPWSIEDARQFCDHWPVGTMPRLAFELFLCAGVRRGDMHVMGPQHIKGRTLYMRTQKKDVPITITLTDRAMSAIDATPTGDFHFMARQDGSAFASKESFGNWFSAQCRAAGLEKGKSAHGIRKLAATLAANGGATTHELMAHFGWQTVDQAEIYTKGADRARLGAESSARLRDEIENSLSRTGTQVRGKV